MIHSIQILALESTGAWMGWAQTYSYTMWRVEAEEAVVLTIQ